MTRRYNHQSPLQGLASVALGLVLVFTFPIWMPYWVAMWAYVGSVITNVLLETL